MRRIAALLLALTSAVCCAQNANPQSSWASQVLVNSPSVYLNFNEPTSTFHDQVSNTAFVSSASFVGTINPLTGTIWGQGGSNQAEFAAGGAQANGTLQSISVQYVSFGTPGSAGLTFLIGTISGSSITVTNSFTVPVTNTASLQTFVAGTDFAAGIPISAGQLIGVWSSGNTPGISTAPGYAYYNLSTTSVPVGANTFSYNNNNQLQVSAVINASTSSGTVTPLQAGMTQNNYSAAFPYNGWRAAPNNTMGAIDWSTPWSLVYHIDNLQFDRGATPLVLVSKGDLAGTSWSLYLQMNGLLSQLCFNRTSYGTVQAHDTQCTANNIDATLNGLNYNIAVTDDGTGDTDYGGEGTTPAITIYVNGLNSSTSQNAGGYGFGGVVPSVSGGTGYPAEVTFSSTGGGPNCHVQGVMWSTGGVPYNTSANWYPDAHGTWGCTSVPTLVLASSSGTGAVLTATLNGASMDSPTLPLMVPGSISGGSYQGVGGGDTAQNPVNVDEFAIFPGVLSQTQIQDLFYQSQFFRTLLGTPPANPVPFIFDDDTCNDPDNFFALQASIAAHRLGYIQIEGAVTEDGTGTALFRQMLDQAGLSNVPVGNASPGEEVEPSAGCSSANLTAYNASTDQNAGDYPTAATVYRTVMAANPTTPVEIFLAGSLNGLYQFMTSSADSISPLSGTLLFNRDAANGANIYTQGGGCVASSPPATTPCTGFTGAQWGSDGTSLLYSSTAAAYVYNNHGAMPMVGVGGNPSNSGPGISDTRTLHDPMYLFVTGNGTDVRPGWDSGPMSAFISPFFRGGMNIGYSGGTGYAATTYGTFSGGGANCHGAFIMTASGGVPNGIETPWGVALPTSNNSGIGYGCDSPPTLVLTAPTGTGVTLTAYPENICGTPTITPSATSPSDSFASASGTCTTNVYVSPVSYLANGSSGTAPVFTWFLNSLIDPPPNNRALQP